MRCKLTLFIAVLLLLVALPFTAEANGAGVTDWALDFTLDSGDPMHPGDEGDGWAWDESSLTLALSGVNIDVGLKNEEFAIKLPDGARVLLAAGSDNRVANSCGMGILCCDGSLEVTGGGDLGLATNAHGIRAYNNLTIDMTGKMDVTVTKESWECEQMPMGLRVGKPGEGGDLTIRNCSTLSVSAENQGLRVDGDVSISGCGEVSILSQGMNGIRNFGDVNITGCHKAEISGWYNGIRSEGDVVIASCPDIQVKSIHELEGNEELGLYLNGIYTSGGGVTITDSALTVYGAAYGIATGTACDYGQGGDIVIIHSFVSASCHENGNAAVYAGDDVPFGGGGAHAKIVLNGCTVTNPASGRVLDVSIEDWGYDCQSITSVASIEKITDWDEAAKAVTIEPPVYFALIYDANGGSGAMVDANSPYLAGAVVTVSPCLFTPPTKYTFSGWNTKADGSGIAYAPGATFTIAGSITLYAQYSAVKETGDKGTEDKGKELPPTSGGSDAPFGFISTACLLGGLMMLVRRRQCA